MSTRTHIDAQKFGNLLERSRIVSYAQLSQLTNIPCDRIWDLVNSPAACPDSYEVSRLTLVLGVEPEDMLCSLYPAAPESDLGEATDQNDIKIDESVAALSSMYANISDDNIKVSISYHLTDKLVKRDVPLSEFAKRLGLSSNAVYNWHSRKCAIRTSKFSKVAQVAVDMGVPMHSLRSSIQLLAEDRTAKMRASKKNRSTTSSCVPSTTTSISMSPDAARLIKMYNNLSGEHRADINKYLFQLVNPESQLASRIQEYFWEDLT